MPHSHLVPPYQVQVRKRMIQSSIDFVDEIDVIQRVRFGFGPAVPELARGLEPLTFGLQIRCSTS